MRFLIPGMELWACDFLRRELAALSDMFFDDVEVDNRFPEVPAAEAPEKLVVIQQTSAANNDLHLAEVTLQVNVFAGSWANPDDCYRLARVVHAIFADSAVPGVGNPVAAVNVSRGLVPVRDERRAARLFSTFDFTVVCEVLDH